MKKIVMMSEIREALDREENFLQRTDFALFTAASNDDALRIHWKEKADVIVTRVDAPGMSGEQLCSSLWSNPLLRNVSVVMFCPESREGRERGARCKANVLLTLPVTAQLLICTVQQLLDIPVRKSLRVLLEVKVEGDGHLRPFYGRSEDISTSGLLLETDKDLNEGEKIACSFLLPGSVRISAVGDVVRAIRPPLDSHLGRYGIRFTELSREAAAAIEHYTRQTAKLPG